MARTQKGKGLRWIALGSRFNFNIEVRLLHSTVLSLDDVETRAEHGLLEYPFFVRPCPVIPRHGFVDSRVVTDRDQLKGVINEVRAVEPDAEVALCKPINATLNAIVSNGSAVFGPGNDGATSGHESVSIPIPSSIYKHQVPTSIVPPDEEPYWELVYDRIRGWVVVQVRSGPRTGFGDVRDYIPNQVIIRKIIEAGGDLLRWESLVRKLSQEEGVVVYHPGGTLYSHYAVHCIVNGVPVVTSFRPEIGQVLDPTTSVSSSSEGFIRGFRSAWAPLYTHDDDEAYERVRGMLVLALYILRATSVMGSWWRGLGSGLIVRTGHVLCHGEGRYHGNSDFYGCSRSYVYGEVLNHDLSSSVRNLIDLLNLFLSGGWSSGYGGLPWVRFAEHLVLLSESSVRGDEKASVEIVNKVVHLCHNNGWVMNKLFEQTLLDAVSDNPLSVLFKHAPIIYPVLRSVNQYHVTDENIEIDTSGFSPIREPRKKILTVQVRHLPESYGVVRFQARYNTTCGSFYREWDENVGGDIYDLISSLTATKPSMYGTDKKYVKLKGYGSWFGVNPGPSFVKIVSRKKVLEHYQG